MSLLTMIQDVALSLGLINEESDLTQVMANTDPTINQLRALANKEGRDLSSRYDWSGTIRGAVFLTTTSTTLQGTFQEGRSALKFIATTGFPFSHIIANSMWDRTNSRPIPGSITHQKVQQSLATNTAGPFIEYYENDKSLTFYPATGSATATIAYMYKSSAWVKDSSLSDTWQEKWLADDDVGILDENIMALGIEWRYLKSKGFDYSEEFNSYERRVQEAILHDRSHPVINLETSRIGGPGVLGVNDGSWPAV